MGALLEEIRTRHAGYDTLTGLQQVRLIRQHCYSRIVLASIAELHLPKAALDAPLPDVFGAFDRNEGGVWCGGAARVLARAYLEAGFRAWKYDYGSLSPVRHSITLVEADGGIYVQDAYFNTEYVDEAGAPVPLFDVLQGLRSGRAPRLLQEVDCRKGLFVSHEHAREWLATTDLASVAFETLSPGRVLCRFPMTFEGYRSVYFEARRAAEWLGAAGYPDDWSYLLLHPRRRQRFLSASPGVPEAPLHSDRDMASAVRRAVSLPASAPRPSDPIPGDPSVENRRHAPPAARLTYMSDRIDELLEDIVALVEENCLLRENNRRLKEKLAGVRGKLARARARKP